ncbi:asparagine synthase (glutamine-hydrolyzing) [Lachnospiraceae bacterium OttesenSCG-928-J05]|nr:asparagine synthase (glutamine-hydrolyzing) [Lachnospiraceae bacterium OttesenSCG-928-J05]
MCGFTGFYSAMSASEKEKLIDEMGEKIVHRGPDSKGSFTDDYVAFGFRRLSIIDLEGGTQPITSSDGNYVIIFNGEIYNYRELRQDLIDNHGAKFQTNSDTEVIIETYKVYKEETAARLRGMFAFVIYEKDTHKLYGARDYFGIKPFHYAKMGDTFIFGSEIKSFLPHPDFKKEVNKEALKMYLVFQYTPTEESIFKNVYKLTPGTYFTYDGKEFQTKRYFTMDYEIAEKTFDETVKLIEETVQSSVDYHQIADVEVGSFLSGGVDSSYIASSVKPMKTYSVGFDVEGFDETGYSEELCRLLKMKNVKKEITPDEFFDSLPMVQYHSDEPHANLSAVPLYYLAELAAKDVKVVLSGEGADEMFGGYESYQSSAIGEFYKAITTKKFRHRLAKWAADRPYFKGQAFLQRNADTVEDGYIGQAFIMNNEEAEEILAPAYQSEIKYQDITKPYFDKMKGMDDLHKKMYLDMHVWLPNDILLKADRMTMAHSLELRVPYLDREVWNLSRTMKSRFLIDKGVPKFAFRTAALAKIPTEWAKRKKLGFMVPIKVWLREDKYYNQVKAIFEKDYVSEFFDQKLILQMLEEHKAKKKAHHRKLYTIYSFLLWYEQYFVLR